MRVWSLQKHVLLCSHAAVITKILQYPSNTNTDSLIPLVSTHIRLYSLRRTQSPCRIVIFCTVLSAFLQRNLLMSHHTRQNAIVSHVWSAQWAVHSKFGFERDWWPHSVSGEGFLIFFTFLRLKTEFWKLGWMLMHIFVLMLSTSQVINGRK